MMNMSILPLAYLHSLEWTIFLLVAIHVRWVSSKLGTVTLENVPLLLLVSASYSEARKTKNACQGVPAQFLRESLSIYVQNALLYLISYRLRISGIQVPSSREKHSYLNTFSGTFIQFFSLKISKRKERKQAHAEKFHLDTNTVIKLSNFWVCSDFVTDLSSISRDRCTLAGEMKNVFAYELESAASSLSQFR